MLLPWFQNQRWIVAETQLDITDTKFSPVTDKNGSWKDLAQCLQNAKDEGTEIPKDVVIHYIQVLKSFSNQVPGIDSDLIHDLERWCESLSW